MKIRAYLLPICFFSGSFSASELEKTDPSELDVGKMHPLKHGNYVAKKTSEGAVNFFGAPNDYFIVEIIRKKELQDEPIHLKCTNFEWENNFDIIRTLETEKLEKMEKEVVNPLKIKFEFIQKNKVLNEELEKIEKELENTHFNKPE